MDNEKAEDIIFEVDYWRSVLNDASEINDQLKTISETISPLIPMAAEIALAMPYRGERILDVVSDTQTLILKGQQTVTGLIQLASGRLKVLREKVDNA